MLIELTTEEGLLLSVNPDRGGRIEQLHDPRTGQDWIWRTFPKKNHLSPLAPGAPYEEHWSGGLEEVFPNATASVFQGRNLLDHGELWSQPWQVVSQAPHSVHLRLNCRTFPVIAEKSISILSGNRIALVYLLTNRSSSSLPFLFRLHAALPVDSGDEILAPDAYMEPVDPQFGTRLAKNRRSIFPLAYDKWGEIFLLDRAQGPEAGTRECVYLSELNQGFCGVKKARTGASIQLRFNPIDFPYLLMLLSYGGWQGHQVAILQPSTTFPNELGEAHKQRTCQTLQPFETRRFSLSLDLEASPGTTAKKESAK